MGLVSFTVTSAFGLRLPTRWVSTPLRRVRAMSCLRSSNTQLRVMSWPTALSVSRRIASRSKNISGVMARPISDLPRESYVGTPWRSSIAPVMYMLRHRAFSVW
ncbi:hypothetical protein D3C80_1510600 [compost metagenome]